ncbi:MAG: radical SAM domain-containing protein [Thermoleophilia bacterium]
MATRRAHPDVERAMAERWAGLPEGVRTPAQMLGQRFLGCEGTHGVFPRCNLACTPCYHSREANHVRVDAEHTLQRVGEQMAHLRAVRGPGQHAQLIGGEVTLLGPEAHAAALGVMLGHGRKPMSMSHGDFDYDYLKALAVDPHGRRRFPLISFAVHVDSTMLGRRAARRPESEAELNGERRRICDMFARLRTEHGVRNYLAHNMTVTPGNLDQVAQVIRDCRAMGFRMFSFQPAAMIGDPRRWSGRSFTADQVWGEIERGAGTRLPFGALQVGDVRCNRTTWGFDIGGRYVPVLDDRDPRDLRARDLLMRAFPGLDFGTPPMLLAAKLLRIVARHPAVVPEGIAWAVRFVRRAGVTRLLRHRPRPLTFVMHSFMDARVVRPAWEQLQRGITADDPELRETQERLRACSYSMAHPEDGRLIPACVQHAVLDPVENLRLRELLPLVRRPDAEEPA